MRARLCATGRYSARDFAGLRSVMDLDDRITAPSFGFGNAANYYRTQSALGFLDAIRVPDAAHPGEGRHVHSVRDFRIGGGALESADRAAGDGARRPSRFPGTPAAPFMGGSRDNGLDPIASR